MKRPLIVPQPVPPPGPAPPATAESARRMARTASGFGVGSDCDDDPQPAAESVNPASNSAVMVSPLVHERFRADRAARTRRLNEFSITLIIRPLLVEQRRIDLELAEIDVAGERQLEPAVSFATRFIDVRPFGLGQQ